MLPASWDICVQGQVPVWSPPSWISTSGQLVQHSQCVTWIEFSKIFLTMYYKVYYSPSKAKIWEVRGNYSPLGTQRRKIGWVFWGLTSEQKKLCIYGDISFPIRHYYYMYLYFKYINPAQVLCKQILVFINYKINFTFLAPVSFLINPKHALLFLF